MVADASVSTPRARMRAWGVPCLSILIAFDATATTRSDVDVVGAFQQDRIERLGFADATRHTTAAFVAEMLVDPASPYSELVALPRFTNEVAWPELVSALAIDEDDALAVMQWDLGMTKARPGVDVTSAPGYRDPFVAASARKADVDADIFWKALDLTGNRYSTLAATYAVGLQVLRRQIAQTEPADRDALGIDEGVFDRVMAASDTSEVRSYDLHYLATLVQFRLIHWQPGQRASTGLRDLPMAYRIARVAAAYRDTQGYITQSPCLANATPRRGAAGTGADADDRPLCFVAATDRAVHRWYLREYRLQVSGWIPNQHTHDGAATFLQLALGTLALLDIVGFIESVEAQLTENLVEGDVLDASHAEFANERADLLTCRIPE